MTRQTRVKYIFKALTPSHALCLMGYINQMPKRCKTIAGTIEETEDGTRLAVDTSITESQLYFEPDHTALIKALKVKEPIYWALVENLRRRNLLTKSPVKSKEYRIEFDEIERLIKQTRRESIFKKLMGRK